MFSILNFAFEVSFAAFTNGGSAYDGGIFEEKCWFRISLAKRCELSDIKYVVGGDIVGVYSCIDGDFFFEHVGRDGVVCIVL